MWLITGGARHQRSSRASREVQWGVCHQEWEHGREAEGFGPDSAGRNESIAWREPAVAGLHQHGSGLGYIQLGNSRVVLQALLL